MKMFKTTVIVINCIFGLITIGMGYYHFFERDKSFFLKVMLNTIFLMGISSAIVFQSTKMNLDMALLQEGCVIFSTPVIYLKAYKIHKPKIETKQIWEYEQSQKI